MKAPAHRTHSMHRIVGSNLIILLAVHTSPAHGNVLYILFCIKFPAFCAIVWLMIYVQSMFYACKYNLFM
jgi:hypothetical protein